MRIFPVGSRRILLSGFLLAFVLLALATSASAQDADGDGVLDGVDVCVRTPDPTQLDTDSDGVGDACDCRPDAPDADLTDADGNGLIDTCQASALGVAAYLEDFVGETAFPATPELDPFAMGGLAGGSLGNGTTPPVPAGDSVSIAIADVSAGPGGAQFEASTVALTGAPFDPARSVVLAAEWSSVSIAGDPGTVGAVGLALTAANGALFRAQVTSLLGQARFETLESDAAGVTVADSVVPLPAIPSSFRIEVSVDRAAQTATGILDTGSAVYVSAPLALSASATQPIGGVAALSFVFNDLGSISISGQLDSLDAWTTGLLPQEIVCVPQTNNGMPDGDGDGLSDDYERLFGLSPSDSDEDGNLVLDGLDDFDADTLSNELEAGLCSNPLDGDTDADLFGDAFENANPAVSDVLDPDTNANGVIDGLDDGDGDGLSNAAEVAAGTSLSLTDSDSDGIDDGDESAVFEFEDFRSIDSGLIGTSARGLVATADLDGDGDQDYLASDDGDTEIYWYENDGSPTQASEWTRRSVSQGTGNFFFPAGIAVADLDGDGDPDVAGIHSTSSSGAPIVLSWFANDGAPADTDPWQRFFVDANPPAFERTVAVGDIDGDGDPDLLSAATGSGFGELAWLENTGQPSVWVRHVVATATSGYRTVASADLDRDGDLDLVATSAGAEALSWYENDGTPGTAEPWAASTIVDAPRDYQENLAIFDADGDGDLDIFAGRIDFRLDWFENDGTPGGVGDWTLRSLTLPDFGFYGALAAGDIDGDFDVDLVFESTGLPAEVEIARNQGVILSEVEWESASAWGDEGGPPDSLLITDVDEDGNADLVALQFSEADTPGLVWRRQVKLDPTVADFDQDGLVDGLETRTGVFTGEGGVAGSDPFNPDTDGNGFSDGWEFNANFDPNDPDQPDFANFLENPASQVSDQPKYRNLSQPGEAFAPEFDSPPAANSFPAGSGTCSVTPLPASECNDGQGCIDVAYNLVVPPQPPAEGFFCCGWESECDLTCSNNSCAQGEACPVGCDGDGSYDELDDFCIDTNIDCRNGNQDLCDFERNRLMLHANVPSCCFFARGVEVFEWGGANPDPAANADADTYPDGCDNCPADANTDQADADGDLRGDACDTESASRYVCGDTDEDGCDDCSYGFFDPNNDGINPTGSPICVPEPGSAYLLVCGVVGLFGLGQRRRVSARGGR